MRGLLADTVSITAEKGHESREEAKTSFFSPRKHTFQFQNSRE